MTQLGRAAALCAALSLIGLPGCEEVSSLHLDPLSTQGRTGNAPAVTYEAVMHVAAAARAGGDFGNAVSMYRHAAKMEFNSPDPLIGLGDTLLEMGQANDAILNYNAALRINPRAPEALRGLAKAYLKTGRPDLAGNPLAVAYQDTPSDPKLLMLIGVADDFIGQHEEAQGRYLQGLTFAPCDRAISLNLALSLALSGRYGEAVRLLQPIVHAPGATPRERQTLALIYGLKGDQREARLLALIDLDPASVDHNLAFYESLRRLTPDARSRAVLSASAAQRAVPGS
jgi:Flp pilus assembly protein TadD